VQEPKTAALTLALKVTPPNRNANRDQTSHRGNGDSPGVTTRKASNRNQAASIRTIISAIKTVSVDPMTVINKVVTSHLRLGLGRSSVGAHWVIPMQHSVSSHQRHLISSPRLKIRRSVRIITNRYDVI
jgi:hypothetical protein